MGVSVQRKWEFSNPYLLFSNPFFFNFDLFPNVFHYKCNIVIWKKSNLFPNVFQHKCNVVIWNWSNGMHHWPGLWILMAWCFSTRPSVATMLNICPWHIFPDVYGVNTCGWNIMATIFGHFKKNDTSFKTLQLKPNGHHFANGISKSISFCENLGFAPNITTFFF